MIVLTRLVLVVHDDALCGLLQANQAQWLKQLQEEDTVVTCDTYLALPACVDHPIRMARVVLCEPVLRGVVDMDTECWVMHMPSVQDESPSNHAHATTAFHDHVYASNDLNGLCFALDMMDGGTDASSEADSGSGDDGGANVHLLHDCLRVHTIQHVPKGVDASCTIFASAQLLIKLNIVHNEWVLVGRDKRPCRIMAVEHHYMVHEWSIASDTVDWIACTSLLAFNLGLQPSCSSDGTIALWKSGLLFSIEPPVATSITLARVAAPVSQNAQMQAEYLKALTKWFQSSNRLCRVGDIVQVTMDTNAVSVATNVTSAMEEQRKQVHTNVDANTSTEALKSMTAEYVRKVKKRHHIQQEALVHFVVTQMEPIASEGWRGLDRVDPEHTRVLTSGVVHSRVPAHVTPGTMAFEQDAQEEEEACFHVMHQVRRLFQASLIPLPPPFDAATGSSILLYGARGVGKTTGIQWACSSLGLHVLHVNCFTLVHEAEAKTEAALTATFDKAMDCAPCVLYLQHIHALAKKSAQLETGQESKIVKTLQQCITNTLSKAYSQYPILVVGTTTDKDTISPSMAGCFQHAYTVQAPNEMERLAILRTLTHRFAISRDVSLKSVAMQTAAFLANDLSTLVSKAERHARERAYAAKTSDQQPVIASLLQEAGVVINGYDLSQCLAEMRSTFSDNIGAPKIPNVQWADIGGLVSAKQDILDTVQLPLEHPELFANGMKKRSGVLLYGPPGSGKTLLAKAVATSCSLNFFSVKGPELLNMYIGESEANVRRVFQRARDARPCVIFFDELDSIAPKRGEKGDSGGVMDRIVSQLLAELDGISGGESADNVFVMGATNRPDLLDAALLRPGRFDKLIYLGVSNDPSSQLHILKALTRKFHLDPALDLQQVAVQCPINYTGADLYAVCSDAMLTAMIRTAQEAEAQLTLLNASRQASNEPPYTIQHYLDHVATDAQIQTIVTMQDFEHALSNVAPSVSMQELAYYDGLRQHFQQAQTR